MLSGSTALVTVRRKDEYGLSKVSSGLTKELRSATPLLQMLFAELASLRQQLNAMVVARPGSVQTAKPSGQTTNAETYRKVEPSRLRRIFD